MHSPIPVASLYFHYNLLHVSVKFCQLNRLTNVVCIYINSNKFDRLPVTSYHTMFECMFFTKPMEKFNSIAHCSCCDWVLFFVVYLQYGQRPKFHCNQNSHAMTKWIPFAFTIFFFLLSFGLGSFLLTVCCRSFLMNFQYLFSRIPFYPDGAETELRQFSVKLQWNLQSDCIRYHAINTQIPGFGCALFFQFCHFHSINFWFRTPVFANYIRYHRFFAFSNSFTVRDYLEKCLHSQFSSDVLNETRDISQEHFGTSVSMQKKLSFFFSNIKIKWIYVRWCWHQTILEIGNDFLLQWILAKHIPIENTIQNR